MEACSCSTCSCTNSGCSRSRPGGPARVSPARRQSRPPRPEPVPSITPRPGPNRIPHLRWQRGGRDHATDAMPYVLVDITTFIGATTSRYAVPITDIMSVRLGRALPSTRSAPATPASSVATLVRPATTAPPPLTGRSLTGSLIAPSSAELLNPARRTIALVAPSSGPTTMGASGFEAASSCSWVVQGSHLHMIAVPAELEATTGPGESAAVKRFGVAQGCRWRRLASGA